MSSLEMLFLLLGLLVLALCGAALTILVIPKLRPCDIPVPPMRNYLLGHFVYKEVEIRERMSFYLRWMKEYGEVFQVWMLHNPHIITANATDVHQIVSQQTVFTRSPAYTRVLSETLPESLHTISLENHRLIRRQLRETFNPQLLGGFHSQTALALHDLDERFARLARQSRPVDLSDEVADSAAMVITNVAFGADYDRDTRRRFTDDARSFMREIIKAIVLHPLRPILAALGFRKALFERGAMLLAHSEYMMSKRQEERAGKLNEHKNADLLDSIMAVDNASDQQKLSNITFFAVGGFDTITVTVSWAVYELCCHPEVVSKLREEVDRVFSDGEPQDVDDAKKLVYTTYVWKEVLRLHPPATNMLRNAAKDVVLKGSNTFVPKGTSIVAFTLGAHRNPKHWSRPDDFWPERFDSVHGEAHTVPTGAYMPFSTGPHRCPGDFLASYEGVLILATLYRRFAFKLACEPDEVHSCHDFVQAPRAPNPDAPEKGLTWGVPVTIGLREQNT